jgi:ribonuclease BN (tRNA processing enzyme)
MLLEYVLSIPFSSQLENVGSREASRSCEQDNHVYCPFLSVRNVEVEHCRDAFALILELRAPLKSKSEQPFVLCFSGDTRPSDNLVQACRRSNSPLQLTSSHWQSTSVPPPPPPRVALLIHEATFMHDENGIQDAEKKRHSTATEALNIAEQIQARSCLLTHFSQRYMHVSISDVCTNSTPNHHSFDWGIGVDGMVVPLTKHVTAILHQLSRCVDSIVMQTLRNEDENK